MSDKEKNELCALEPEELKQINGGATDNGTSSITMSSSADSLLSMDYEWRQGDMSRSWKISAGNDIDLNLSAFGNRISK